MKNDQLEEILKQVYDGNIPIYTVNKYDEIDNLIARDDNTHFSFHGKNKDLRINACTIKDFIEEQSDFFSFCTIYYGKIIKLIRDRKPYTQTDRKPVCYETINESI